MKRDGSAAALISGAGCVFEKEKENQILVFLQNCLMLYKFFNLNANKCICPP